MIRKSRTILFAILALTLVIPAQGTELPTSFFETHYYILSLGMMSADLGTLVQTAQSTGYSVVQYEGDETSDDLIAALADDSILIVDGDRFYLRQVADTYTFTVRPSETGYELVINPVEDLAINDTLASVLIGLQEIGLLGNEVNLEFASFAKAELKGPAPPTGAPIDSGLYGLVVAEDWFAYAASKGFTQIGLRVTVVAEKIPGSTLAAEFGTYVTDETESLAKLLLPIDQLVPLAESASIGYVRVAYQPRVP